jgi:phage terminase small subunit
MERPRKRRFTDKMEAFCLVYMETNNASEAYRRSYNVTNMAEKTAARESWIVLQKPQVQARIAELREAVMDRHQITVDTLLLELEEARKAALGAETPQTSAAVSATMGKAKLLGLDKKIVEITGKNGGAIETKSQVTVDKKALESVLDRL